MIRKALYILALVAAFASSRPATAQTWITISDASLVQFQTNGTGFVYFRNLNAFNANALGCCYNYWIDTTTQEGKNIYALILSFIPQAHGFAIALPTNFAAGQLTGAMPLNAP